MSAWQRIIALLTTAPIGAFGQASARVISTCDSASEWTNYTLVTGAKKEGANE